MRVCPDLVRVCNYTNAYKHHLVEYDCAVHMLVIWPCYVNSFLTCCKCPSTLTLQSKIPFPSAEYKLWINSVV